MFSGRVEHAHRLRGARVVRAAKKAAKTIVSSPSVRASSHERAFDTTTVVVVVDTNLFRVSSNTNTEEGTLTQESGDVRSVEGEVCGAVLVDE